MLQSGDISTRKRRGALAEVSAGVVGIRAGRTTPAMTFGHGIPSSTEEGSISSML
jgi:hypothetical protein